MNEAAALFGESASRVIVSTAAANVADVLARAAALAVPARAIGQTGGNLLRIAVAGRTAVDVPVTDLERRWSASLENALAARVA
jgi:phosphoribosylformylglycinamidine synthase